MRWTKPPTSLEHVPALAAGGLMGRYLHDPEFAREFYGAHPGDEDALRARAEMLAARSYPRKELAAILRRQNGAWRLSEETARQIDALEQGAFCAFTGQQTGLFTGPLYTVYKALTTVAWARHVTDLLAHPVVPVFWLAADDHDLEEINHAVLPDANGRPRTLRYAASDDAEGRRVSRRTFGEDILPWLGDALSILGEGPGRADVLRTIRDAYQPGCSWADACAHLLAGWLGRFGLVLVSPDDPELKQLMAPLFQAEISDPEASRQALAERDAAISAAGYAPQVGRTEHATLLFMDDEAGVRRRIDLAGDGYVWKGRDRPLSRRALRNIFEAEPERFSANALLRPVTADAVFPTLVQVMGPGEVAYMAQARGLYFRHDVLMPLVLPRARFTMIPREIERLLGDESLSLEDAFQPVDRWIGKLASAEKERQFGGALEACRQELDAAYERLDDAVRVALPGVRNAVASARMKTQGLANKLERTLAQEMRRRERTRKDRLERIGNALYPLGEPQERVYTVAPYLVRYGVGWLDAVLEVIDVHTTAHLALWPDS